MKLLKRCGAFLVLLGPSLCVHGALGERADSIPADQARLSGTLQTTARDTHVLHEIAAATGTVVREYATSSGIVFAVAWEGPFLPDLKQLMGAYYDRYVEAARQPRRHRGPLVLVLPGLVFESGGHPRGFRGRAYVPELVPTEVTLENVR